ncbi:helicase HerA domain-containing protein [Ruminococcus flavefaciens]|uniref:helicase HerA domain-containing protein n=1 Tax=Ruminococcus flavefaciens TaxID=1265 RepID=UPI0002E0D489|nr:DUF87 domain-containing protein [Ruminococcus flavefaciens]
MGIKHMITKAGSKAADRVAKLSVLSPEQLDAVQKHREAYLAEAPSLDDEAAEELTSRLLAASSVEVFNEYLKHIHDMYVPIQRNIEYGTKFRSGYNIRYFEITKWVTNKKENSLEKLVNIYEVLSNEPCNIALIFHRSYDKTQVFIAVTNTNNSDDNVDANNYRTRLAEAIRGNFPGSELSNSGSGTVPCLNNNLPYSVACASNIPGEKSEKFVSQTIEKLLDGIVPDSPQKEYTIVLLATPVSDVENRKIHLAELYSGLAPYAGWETNFTFTQSDSVNSSATFGINVGASAGIQHGQNKSNTTSQGTTENSGKTETDTTSSGETNTDSSGVTDTTGETNTTSNASSKGGSTTDTHSTASGHSEGTSTSQSHNDGTNSNPNILKGLWHTLAGGENGTSVSDMAGSGTSISDTLTETASTASSSTFNNTKTESIAKNVAKAVTKNTSKALSNTVGKSVANTLGRAVTNTVAATSGIYKGVNLGANVGANFARASNVTATVGKNEGIVQHFSNYTIKHLLENLEMQMKRFEQSTALGMWDFAAYVLSEDQNVANNVAYSYLALTQGEKSYVSQTAVNLWRGDMDESDDAKEICSYIRELRHPIFALNPNLTAEIPIANVYPAVITPTTSLSGKELAYSLNFPSRSIAGLPVINCAEFGRDVVFYDMSIAGEKTINLGNIYHMNHTEPLDVNISLQSLASHTFITGSTGSGKSNTVYKMILEAINHEIKFMVIEPAKGEYKNIFGNNDDVSVFGTNPDISPLLRINPFSFPKGIHIYEHMDRLVEIFNVCWPMYAAMPAVLKNAIERAYEDCGWDLVNSHNPFGESFFPTFADVARNIREIIDTSEYDTENKGAYKGSLLTRLNSLSNGINGLVFTTDEIPANELFDANVIIDLSRVGSSETKSLIMGMMVLKLQEYRISCAKSGNAPLKHITILEEAHNILKRTSTDQPVEGGNLVGKSVEMISNAIAEMRTYGEGFIIVDQAPGLMDMSVIRNTNTKIIMRLPDQSDRELVGKSANLDDDQIKELAKTPCGVAAIYQNEWIQPILCKVSRVDYDDTLYEYSPSNLTSSKDDYEIRIKIADMLSKGMRIGQEVSREEVIDRLNDIHVSDSIIITVLKLMENPPIEPNMKKLAPVMNALFPDIKRSIEAAYENESDVTQWTREANELLIKYSLDDQVRRDIIQGAITYYLINETNNRASLEDWIQRGGLR